MHKPQRNKTVYYFFVPGCEYSVFPFLFKKTLSFNVRVYKTYLTLSPIQLISEEFLSFLNITAAEENTCQIKWEFTAFTKNNFTVHVSKQE